MRVQVFVDIMIYCNFCSRHDQERTELISKSQEDDPHCETNWRIGCKQCSKELGIIELRLQGNDVNLRFSNFFLNSVEGKNAFANLITS